VTDGKQKSRVALFVDFDHLRRFTEGAQRPICPLSSAIEAVAHRVQEMGDVVTANVYADWEKLPGKQAEVKRLHFDPRFVFSNANGPAVSLARTNGSVVCMALDAQESLFNKDDVDTYVLVSDDLGLIDLISRIKKHGKKVMVIGFERGMSPDVLNAPLEFEALESYVQPSDVQPTGDTPPSPEAYYDDEDDQDGVDWEPFILLLNRLEGNLPFVSLKYLKNSVLTPAHGCENTMESKANLIREAIRLKFIDTEKIPNPRNPHYDTTTCHLNRTHPEVRRILGQT
jgi:hypothetical protein